LFVTRALKVLKYSGYFLLSSSFGILAIGAGIFIHDAFTYTDKHVHCVPVSPLALHPETGGPKNLPVAKVQVEDEEDEENVKLAEKPRLVIVGGGWGVSLRAPSSFSQLTDTIFWVYAGR
jgi:NADH dehydrogenase